MKFIRKKNFHEGEELLYVPVMHWMYTVRCMVLSLPFFILLLVLWFMINPGLLFGYSIRDIITYLFFAVLLLNVLIFIGRIFQYINTEYGVTNKRLMIKKGVISQITAEIPTDRIESIYCTQGLLGRIFRYGTIHISGVGGMKPVLYMICRPYAARRKIVEIIEKNKTIHVIHGDLPRAKTVIKPEPIAEEEPMYRYGTFVRVVPAKGA
ncbi:MAG: PH domain-containing protein [Treponema sp.]|nr:PH domain-containing protein [Treponema sp.]